MQPRHGAESSFLSAHDDKTDPFREWQTLQLNQTTASQQAIPLHLQYMRTAWSQRLIVDGKRDISGRYIPFKRSVRHLDRQTSCHKFLILHGTRRQLRRASIATMKAHKGIAVCIIKFAENIRFKHIPQDRIVDSSNVTTFSDTQTPIYLLSAP